MKTSNKYVARSFADLGDVLFKKFLDMDLTEKKDYLKGCGIVWGADYLGVYRKKKKAVIIETLENPFTGKPIEGPIIGNWSFDDGTRLAVKLRTGGVAGRTRTPDNIFGFEYVGKVGSGKRYTDLSASAATKVLQEENDKLKRKNSAQEDRIKGLEASFSDCKGKYELLLEDVQAEYESNRNLKQLLEREQSSKNAAAEKALAENEILKNKLNDIKQLADIIINRKIDALLHVTQISNLESILKDGILPTTMLGKAAARNDFARYDGKPNCTSLSIGRVNGYYFRDVMLRNECKQTFVCIYISPAILLDENTKYYCHHNAATSSIKEQTKKGLLTTAEDFANMFQDTVSYTTVEGPNSYTRNYQHRVNWPTSEQAEILYEGVISPDKFLTIGFPTNEALSDSAWLLKKYRLYGLVERSINF